MDDFPTKNLDLHGISQLAMFDHRRVHSGNGISGTWDLGSVWEPAKSREFRPGTPHVVCRHNLLLCELVVP